MYLVGNRKSIESSLSKQRRFYVLTSIALIWLFVVINISVINMSRIYSLINKSLRLLPISYVVEAIITRLHSSRMRTARALTVSPIMFCAGGVCLVCGIVPGPGAGCLVQGVPGPGGGVVSKHALRQTPPLNRITHACENITLPQLRYGR